MIYDRLAYLDKDLNVIPWALESWKKVDNRTWDAKLRGGMKFHDGKPVTVDDLKFSMDFVCQYDRAEFWVSDQFLEKTEILDRANRMVRFTFKQPTVSLKRSFSSSMSSCQTYLRRPDGKAERGGQRPASANPGAHWKRSVQVGAA